VTIGAGGVLNVVGKIFGFAKQKANQAVLDQTRDTIAEVFGSNNWDNITSSNGFSLSHNSNIASLQSQMALVRSHTDTTSARQIKINGNSSNINALQSNTAQLATAIGIHSSNIGSLNQSIITIETDVGTLQTDLASNAGTISNLTSQLSDNSSRIENLEASTSTTSSVTHSNIYASSLLRATHVSLGTPLYPTLGGNWLTIHSSTFHGSLGPDHPDPDGGILFTNASSQNTLPWGYYMGVVKDVASTSGATQRLDIGKSNNLNSQLSSGYADTLTPYLTIDNGNVGINTTSPGRALEIYTGNGTVPGLRLRRYPTGATYTDLRHADSPDGLAIHAGDGNATNLEVMRICGANGGRVGINRTSPSYRLDVSGDTRVVGKCIVQTNNSQNGVVCTGTDGGLSYYGYQDGDPGIKFTRTSVFTGEDSEYTLAILPAPGGTPRPNAVHLGSSSNYWRRTYTHTIHRSFESALSDDRIKTGEMLVENATETLLKLKPQTYDKHSFEFDKFTEEEYSNLSSDNTVFSAHSNCWVDQTELIENTIEDREEFPYIRRRLTEQSEKETGLIAQDIYYDCPELRHLISLPSDATPAEDKPTGSDDPQEDPDYDEAGWGTESASVSYTQIIPVLVKSNQELHERIVEHDAQISDLEAAVASRDQQIDELRSELSDIVSRLEAVESG